MVQSFHVINLITLFLYIDSDDEDLPSDDYRNAMVYRRRSVFAEAYVPGEEECEKVSLINDTF